MSKFQEIQQTLSQTRTIQTKAENALLRVSEQLKQVSTKMEQMGRWLNRNNREHLAQYKALEGQKRRLENLKKEHETEVAGVKKNLSELNAVFFETWTDPRLHTAQMNDDIPVALFPLRLETRFKTVSARDGEQHQLWVRIFPDECLVDTFEETLSQVEIRSAQIFWQEYFRAAGVEAEERSAWRALVASHGSGRATWIIQHFRPLNPLMAGDPRGDSTLAIKPQSKVVGELILVVSVTSTLTDSEQSALAQYWETFWKADGQSSMETVALNRLVSRTGADRARTLIEKFRPYNITEKPVAPLTHEATTLHLVFLVFPKEDAIETKTKSWMQAAKAGLLPERFVLLGYQKDKDDWKEILNELSAPVQAPLYVSPDPAATAESQFQFDAQGNLSVGEDLRWMTDFNEAVRIGMGFRVTLTPQQALGFDRLLVLGLRLSSDATQGKTELETLFKNHYFSRTGFSFIPQGAPTNNTEDNHSAYSRADDANVSYDFVFKGKAQFSETEDWLAKRDGQCFAESLGLDTDWLKQVPHAGGFDQREAHAMNTALWPATLGYFMDTLLQPVFNDDDVYYTRWFFNRFVSGRGSVPAIRIGRQPYGILPTSAFSKIAWVFGGNTVSYLGYVNKHQETRTTDFKDWLWKFKGILDQLHKTWRTLAQQVSHVGVKDKDPHKTLLDILGLHPSSVEFHQRYANTKKQVHNIASLWQKFISWQTLPANELHHAAYARLQQLGYSGTAPPRLFDLFWKVFANRLNGPTIQAGPLSEIEPLRIATTNNRNYIEWLHEWARVSFDTIRVQDGFKDNKSPTALLYILLKHALELGYHDAGIRVLDEAQLLNDIDKIGLRSEPHFFHIQKEDITEKSRYAMLYSPHERVTGDSRMLLVDHVTRHIGELYATRYLNEQLKALAYLSQTPTARLERLMAEHLDCGTYRLDAWMTGLINFQLASMRFIHRNDSTGTQKEISHRKGIYLGAYGWLENIHPENKNLSPVRLTEALDEIFNRQQPVGKNEPLMRDEKNEGYIHAPSVNHAVTAAVLRNGYISNATPAHPELLKVNLSSERVRVALSIIEGIRNGQNLASLLGYQLERGLHDRYSFAESDQFIYPLRSVFPLYTRAGELPSGVSITAIEARNVVNGLNLIRHIKNAAPTNKKYPFGFPVSQLPNATASQQKIIDAEVDRLLDIYDTLADLAIAEGVHQAVMGNYDRVAATLDAYGQATFPPIPDVIQTPRSGIGLTHRVAFHFDPNVTITVADNPRVKAEPVLNQWISTLLPLPTRISCKVTYIDATTGNPQTIFITQAQLGFQALDLIYSLNPDNLQARSELEDRVVGFMLQNPLFKVRPDLPMEITFSEAENGHFTFFEIAPVIRSLRALLLQSRPLHATDVALPTEAQAADAANRLLDRSRVDFLPTALSGEKTNKLLPLQTQLDGVLPESGADAATILANIDIYLNHIITVCGDLARYGLQQTGIGIFYENKAGIFKRLMQKITEIVSRWQKKLDEYESLLLSLAAVSGEAEKIAILLQAEQYISTTFIDPVGKTAAQLLPLIQAKAANFKAKHAEFKDIQKTADTRLSQLLSDFKALLPVTNFDLLEIKTQDEEKQIIILAEDIRMRARLLIEDLDKRIPAITQKLSEHDSISFPEKRIQILTDAARLVFGDEFVLIPSFTLAEKQGEEWEKAYIGRELLLNYQKTVLHHDFPVDDWLYGVARVREKMHHIENLTFLTEALGKSAAELRAIQFPYREDAPWMALEFPPQANKNLERELLLYTAHYAANFDKNQRQCGLLIDEWTEVIPAETETTGISFQFDKPNAEPPQVILLATPPQFSGAWKWGDLVNTLHETLDMARIRAVEPQQLDQTDLAVFLPATILATTWQPITIATDLSLVNQYVDKISGG